jgi:hypothetical protein
LQIENSKIRIPKFKFKKAAGWFFHQPVQKVWKLGFDLTDTLKFSNNYFLKPSFLKILPPCNTSNSNKRNKFRVLGCFPYRNPLEGPHLGKLFAVWGLKFLIATLFRSLCDFSSLYFNLGSVFDPFAYQQPPLAHLLRIRP